MCHLTVECVVTGSGHNDRAPCRVALVDLHNRVSWSAIILVTPVLDPLTAITGLTTAQIQAKGRPFDVVRDDLFGYIGPGMVLVGQKVTNDVGWMQLEAGTHYARTVDLAELFRLWNPHFEHYMYFTLRKQVYVAFGAVVGGSHDPVEDEMWSMRLAHLRDWKKSNDNRPPCRIKCSFPKL
ncbi:hypothetical protein DYB35_001658 [Aphanomyces astaci]|uniref:Exonuclease domain-containing protein n=1 Tax=Aphanomyces astaci TaxID=112090 RepID=A0A3R7A765_APHAT|nr:hypothetical protein DYB35_001658 [Aphanomyces astaci]